MAILSNVMGTGAAAAHAVALVGEFDRIAAAGTDRAGAAVLGWKSVNYISYGSGSVALPKGLQISDEISVLNGTDESVMVYPPYGGSIGDLGDDEGIRLGSGSAVTFRCTDANRFFAVAGGPDQNFGPNFISLLDFNADPTGVADSTTAIQNWLDQAGPQKVLYAPAGIYKFTSALVAPMVDRCALIGAGPRQTLFKYEGATTNLDLLTIGNGISNIYNWYIADFRLASNTVLTGGTALHMKRFNRSELQNIILDDFNGNKLWNGFWFDSVDNVSLLRFEARAQNDPFRVNGIIGVGPKADLFVSHGKISGGAIGVHVGGAFGGLAFDQCDVIGNTRNMVIDTSLVAEGNRELTFGPGAYFDSVLGGVGAGSYSVSIEDTMSLPGYINFSGTWLASNSADGCVYIASGAKWHIVITGGVIFNVSVPRKPCLTIDSSDALVMITGTHIWGGDYGIYSSVTTPKLAISGVTFDDNTNPFNANVLNSSLNINVGPYAWTPAIQFGGVNTGITYSRQAGTYQVIGRRVVCNFSIVMTNKGAATGQAQAAGLPVAASSSPSSSNEGGVVSANSNMSGLGGCVTATASSGSTLMSFLTQGATGTSVLIDTNFTNTSVLNGVVSYFR